MEQRDIYHILMNLLPKYGRKNSFELTPLESGGNNQVYQIQLPEEALLLKHYFRDPEDRRDRGGNEFRFSTYAWNHQIRSIPEPVAYDSENGLGIFRYIEGRKLKNTDSLEIFVRKAVQFFLRLNDASFIAEGRILQSASESCFSLKQHLDTVERRIDQLKKEMKLSELEEDAEASIFLEVCLSEKWEEVKSAFLKKAKELGIDLSQEITNESKCISPSDFGFHNTLLDSSGQLFFLDFEYAGWDDQAKMIGDFFCQPEVPVPIGCFEEMTEAVVDKHTDRSREIQRIKALFPLYQVKWCCILLNEFLPVASKRRSFANRGDRGLQKQKQLSKARFALEKISIC